MQTTNALAAWKKAIRAPLVISMFEGTDKTPEEGWAQAIDLVKTFAPATDTEFRLVVRMCILNLQANHAASLASRLDTTRSQAIRLQSNAVALAKAADKAETRFKQLQAARIQRAKTQDVEQTAAPAADPTPPPAKTLTAKDEAHAIKEYARKHRMTYAEAWGLYQREKKATKAQPAPV
jgi:hypothetical protein